MSDILSAGRRVAVAAAARLAAQDKALDNARRASTEVSRRRVERDEVSLYLEGLTPPARAEASANEWPDVSARTAD